MRTLPTRLGRMLATLLATLLAVATLTGCTETKVTRELVSFDPLNDGVLAVLDANAGHPPGTRPLAEALKGLLPGVDVVTTTTQTDQDARIRAAADQGIGILLVQAVDPTRVGSAMEAAQDDGVLVVAVDTIPKDVGSIDLYVGWDEFSIGEQEVAAFAAHVGTSDGTKHVELFAGDKDDLRAMARFNGAMFALKAFSENGTIVVKSGQTSFGTAALSPGDTAAARKRLTTTYQVTYPRHQLDGVVIPSDSMAPTVIEVAREQGHRPPLLMSSGTSAEGVRMLFSGELLTTQYRDPAVLAARVQQVVNQVRAGQEVETNPQSARRNRLKKTPSVLVSPVLVTAHNAASVLARNPELAPLTKA